MTATFPLSEGSSPINPLDLVEEIVASNDCDCERTAADRITFTLKGRWSVYGLQFYWDEGNATLYFAVTMDLQAESSLHALTWETLGRMNDGLGIGYFSLCCESGRISYRHACLWRGALQVHIEQIEDLIEIALGECERFYPVVYAVLRGQCSPVSALDTALLEPHGLA